jgi:Flp pilus assembly protein TadG
MSDAKRGLSRRSKSETTTGVIRKLLRNEAGNTLAMVGAALVPLMAMIGGGIDVSRIYLVKTRLQQACDAGALAGRRQMGAGSWNADSYAANTAAEAMFAANFDQGSYGTSDVEIAYTENSGTVTGTVTGEMDLAVMQMFGYEKTDLLAECQAAMSVPNTDVMFVLDVTGSMNCPDTGFCPNGNNNEVEVASSRIVGLRLAVRCFYEALAKQDTLADCGSTPEAVNGSTVQIRFGFVPYASNVNVGRLLPHDFIRDVVSYQTRKAETVLQNVVVGYTPGVPYVYSENTEYDGGWSHSGSTANWPIHSTPSATNSNACQNARPDDTTVMSGDEGNPFDFYTWMSGGNQITRWYTEEEGVYTDYEYRWQNGNPRCTIRRRTRDVELTRQYRQVNSPEYEQQEVFNRWSYKQDVWNVSGLKSIDGTSWNPSIALPLGNEGLNTTIQWDGCIEERKTVRDDEYWPLPSEAWDLDIDMIPDPDDPDTQWSPMLRDVVWARYSGGNYTTSTVNTSSNLNRNIGYSCPTPASKLRTWAGNTFDNYVTSLDATGSTYHDAGLIWGARLLSPTGLFAGENAVAANGGAIERHMIFMTDGDTSTAQMNYTTYGLEWYDRRRTPLNSAPSTGDLNDQVNARFLAMCEAIKSRNITLWVVSFGSGVSGDAQENLQDCATSGRWFHAADSDELTANFRAIANEISQLRLVS